METYLGKGKEYIAGKIQTEQLPIAAGTYYPGQALENNAGVLQNKSAGDLAAIYNGDAQRVEVGRFRDDVILGGELAVTGLVDGSNVQLVVSDADILDFAPLGST